MLKLLMLRLLMLKLHYYRAEGATRPKSNCPTQAKAGLEWATNRA